MNQGATNSGFQTTVQRSLLRLVQAPMLTAVHQQRRLEFSHRYRNRASNERRQVNDTQPVTKGRMWPTGPFGVVQ
ncbi:hypothetical protein TNCV_4255581 [Trichonephila clavipes]|nr:hypothetical protein TNCV_4255581 [Trichonephila clavipes]